MYKSGIFDNCGTEVSHDIFVVGWNEASWRLKNSWGVRWGEYGYIRLRTGNTCGICSKTGFGFKAWFIWKNKNKLFELLQGIKIIQINIILAIYFPLILTFSSALRYHHFSHSSLQILSDYRHFNYTTHKKLFDIHLNF